MESVYFVQCDHACFNQQQCTGYIAHETGELQAEHAHDDVVLKCISIYVERYIIMV